MRLLALALLLATAGTRRASANTSPAGTAVPIGIEALQGGEVKKANTVDGWWTDGDDEDTFMTGPLTSKPTHRPTQQPPTHKPTHKPTEPEPEDAFPMKYKIGGFVLAIVGVGIVVFCFRQRGSSAQSLSRSPAASAPGSPQRKSGWLAQGKQSPKATML